MTVPDNLLAKFGQTMCPCVYSSVALSTVPVIVEGCNGECRLVDQVNSLVVDQVNDSP